MHRGSDEILLRADHIKETRRPGFICLKKKQLFDYLPPFLLFKKNPEKIRACNCAENKKQCFCLHPVLKKTVLPEVHLTSHRKFQVA